MQQVMLGRTGLSVKKLGFGGIPIQRVTEADAVETVRHAVEQGIDFIDTSRAYTTSETRIGMALRQTRRPVRIASKSLKRSADGIRSDLEVSLKELQRDTIDLYQCHFVNEADYQKIIAPGGALEGLIRARREGLIGHMGISSHSLDLLGRIVQDNLFDTIMVCLSFLEPASLEKVIPAAIEKNIGVIAMKPMSGGVIENPELALRFALSQAHVLVLCGVETRARFDQNWKIFNAGGDLSEADRVEIEKIVARYDKHFCRRCDYCQPCTEGINIQSILGIRQQVKRMGPEILFREPRLSLIERARNCSGCETCMDRCPYRLPIPQLIRENLDWIDRLR